MRRLAAGIEDARLALQFGTPDAPALAPQIDGWAAALATTRRDLGSRTNYNQPGHATTGTRLHSQDQTTREMTLLAKRVSDALFALLRILADSRPEATALRGVESALNAWMKSTRSEAALLDGPVSAHLQTEFRALAARHPEGLGAAPQGWFDVMHALLSLARALDASRP